jgi:hypothetical protein
MTAKDEEFTVLCAWIPDGIEELISDIFNKKIEEINPDESQLLQPDTYLFFFRQSRRGNARADAAIALLESVRNAHPRLAAMKIGKAAGPLFADISWLGVVKSMPIGRAVADAQKQTRMP